MSVRINHEVRGTGEYASVTAEPAVVVITDDDTEVRPLISIYSDSGTAITEGSHGSLPGNRHGQRPAAAST